MLHYRRTLPELFFRRSPLPKIVLSRLSERYIKPHQQSGRKPVLCDSLAAPGFCGLLPPVGAAVPRPSVRRPRLFPCRSFRTAPRARGIRGYPRAGAAVSHPSARHPRLSLASELPYHVPSAQRPRLSPCRRRCAAYDLTVKRPLFFRLRSRSRSRSLCWCCCCCKRAGAQGL